MVKERNITLITLLLVASLFGLFAQNIAYFSNNYFFNFSPFLYLNIYTFLSYAIYIGVFITVLILARKKLLSKKNETIYSLGLLIGLGISIWSFIVLVMWWG